MSDILQPHPPVLLLLAKIKDMTHFSLERKVIFPFGEKTYSLESSWSKLVSPSFVKLYIALSWKAIISFITKLYSSLFSSRFAGLAKSTKLTDVEKSVEKSEEVEEVITCACQCLVKV